MFRRTSGLSHLPVHVGRVGAVLMAVGVLAAGCGGSSHHRATGDTRTLTVVVDVPLTGAAYVGDSVANGTKLGAEVWNGKIGAILPPDPDSTVPTEVVVGSTVYDFRVELYDNGGSPARAVAGIRHAIAEHAVAVISDGTGVQAGAELANRAHLPICVVYDGSSSLINPTTAPSVFRIAPTDHGIAFRYAEYLVPKHLKIAFLTDDSGYGQGGRAELNHAFSENKSSVVAKIQVSSTSPDLAPAIVQARGARATALLVWGQPNIVAETILAARRAGWTAPIYTPPSGEDPIVRQELAGHPGWLKGVTFASARLTAEVGPTPFLSFQSVYDKTFGALNVGVKAPDGHPIIQPPEFAMYPFDFINLLAIAIDHAQSTDGARILRSLTEVSAEGVNGDQRGFNTINHEGVVDDDIFFGHFVGMAWQPVKDDALSATLPVLDQEG